MVEVVVLELEDSPCNCVADMRDPEAVVQQVQAARRRLVVEA